MPGDMFMERQIRGIVRWNAMAMVMRANLRNSSIGGHISTFASSATLYDVGFNYFFRRPNDQHEGDHWHPNSLNGPWSNPGHLPSAHYEIFEYGGDDLIYYQGHSSPGIYARSFLEGRLDEAQLDNFREEVNGNGLSSYRLIPGLCQIIGNSQQSQWVLVQSRPSTKRTL